MSPSGEVFVSVGSHLVDAEGMAECEDHHSSAIMIIIDSDEKHQWMLKEKGESFTSDGILSLRICLSRYMCMTSERMTFKRKHLADTTLTKE